MACCNVLTADELQGRKTLLWIVLAINVLMFATEGAMSFLAGSAALLADSLDMLGDALVYGLSIYVVTKHVTSRYRASFVKGAVMGVLGLFVLIETIQKLQHPAVPHGGIISGIGVLALLANLICFLLLSRQRGKHDINLRSAWLCSRNDVLANGGVILAGVLVQMFRSPWPDIVVGLGITALVLHSALDVMIAAWRGPSCCERAGCADVCLCAAC